MQTPVIHSQPALHALPVGSDLAVTHWFEVPLLPQQPLAQMVPPLHVHPSGLLDVEVQVAAADCALALVGATSDDQVFSFIFVWLTKISGEDF